MIVDYEKTQHPQINSTPKALRLLQWHLCGFLKVRPLSKNSNTNEFDKL